jgi:hypothetical protein
MPQRYSGSLNILNLPETVSFDDGRSIGFTYTANGQKLRKTAIAPGQAAVTTDYVSGFVYVNNALQFRTYAGGPRALRSAAAAGRVSVEVRVSFEGPLRQPTLCLP